MPLSSFALALSLFASSPPPATASATATAPDDAEQVVAALDTEYQQAVKNNDAATMDRILADDFVLVTGSGRVLGKSELLASARNAISIYERQEDGSRTVRVWGDAAMVTALLWAKGTKDGKPFEYRLWFSDLYLRRPEGWRYVFAQASLALPAEAP